MAAPTTTIDRAPTPAEKTSPRRSSPRRYSTRRAGAAWTEALALLGVAATLTASALIVGPRLLRAGSPAASMATSATGLSAPHAAQHDLVRSLIDSAGRTLALVYRGERSTELDVLVFWTEDSRYPGVVNLSELLVVRYSPVLRSLLAFTWTPAPEDDPAVALRDVRDVRRLETMIGRDDAIRAVIAQPIIGCEITGTDSAQPLRPDTAPARAVIRLTWLEEPTDTRRVGTIVTDLRWVAPSDRF